MNQPNDLGKKRMGSVAVDAETGVEHYGVPKQTIQSQPTEQLQGITPNYLEDSNGKTKNLAGVPEEFLHLFEHDPSEVLLLQALRHPVGVAVIVAVALIAIIVLTAGYAFLLSDDSMLGSVGLNAANIGALGGLLVVILFSLIVGISILAAIVYKKSRLILTNQKVVLIKYDSIISRKVSQLNIGEVEDVNVSQPTIFDRIFKTGTVTIETAGEQNNYVLSQVEKPYEFAQKTIQMHEGSIAEYGN